MDLLSIIIDPNKVKDVCCLCYKKCENMTDLNDDIEIHDEYFNLNSTLGIILGNLFPSHDLILPRICEECSTLTIKLFSLFQRSHMQNLILNYLVDNIEEKIEETNWSLIFKKNFKRCRLKINIPSDDNVTNYKTSNECLQCEKCPMTFKSKLLLKKHIQMSHKTINKATVCDICGKSFTSHIKLKAHLDCHKQKKCPYCFKLFKLYSHFKLHIKNHKSPQKIKRTIKYRNCNDCDYKTSNKSSLEAHMNRVHLKIKPFICDICKKGFYKKVHLKEHLMTHNKIKNNICDVCGETFVNDRTLREHMRLHMGQKPFECMICKIRFVTSGRRYEHIKRKHMEKTEWCSICDKRFSLKKDLNSHLEKVHKICKANKL